MTTYPYTYLSNFMNPDYQEIVIGQSIKHVDKASDKARQRIEKAVRNAGVHAPGFRPGKAPLRTLAKPLHDYFVGDPNIARAVFTLWVESQPALREQVSAFLEEKGLAYIDDLPPEGFSEDWSDLEMEALAGELGITAKSDGARYNDTALMLVCLLGRAPLRSDDAGPDIDPPLPPDPPAESPRERASGAPETGAEFPTPKDVADPPSVVVLDPDAIRESEHTTIEDAIEDPSGKLESDQIVKDMHLNDEDPMQTYERLREQLSLAQSMLESGAWQDLAAWASSCEQQVRRAIGVFAEQESRIAAVLTRLSRTLADSVPSNDAAPFAAEAEALSSDVMTRPAAWVLRTERCQELERSIEAYLAKRWAALQKHLEACEALSRACENARAWGLADDPLMAQTDLTDASGLRLDQLTALNGRVGEAANAVQMAALEARTHFISTQCARCNELREQVSRARPSKVRDTAIADLDVIESLLVDATQDSRLLEVADQLNSISESVLDHGSDLKLAELAQVFKETQDQVDLDRVLEDLWWHKRYVEGFVLLTAAAHAGRWATDSGLPAGKIQHYLQGLVEAIPADEIAPAAADICFDGLLWRLVFHEDSAEGQELLVLAVALFAVYPSTVGWEVMRCLKNVDLSKAAPTWARLADCFQQDTKPTLVPRSQLDTARLTELRSQLNEEFRCAGKRYVHLLFDRNNTLHNMEQKYLLPALEKHWRSLSASTPDQPAWRRSHAWVRGAQATSVLDDQCRRAGVQSLSGFYREDFEGRVSKILDAMREFADLRRADYTFSLSSPFAAEDLLDELASLSTENSPFRQIAHACVQLGVNAKGQAEGANVRDGVQMLDMRLAKVVLDTSPLYSVFPRTAAWLSENVITSSDQWLLLFEVAVEDLANPVDDVMLIQSYLTARLPQIALALAKAANQAEAYEQAKSALGQAKKEVKTSLARLKELGGTPDAHLDCWLRGGRYALVLRDIDYRIGMIQSQRLADATRQRNELRSVYAEAVNLEFGVGDAIDLPAASRTEAMRAVQAIREAWTDSQLYKVAPAREVITEIKHLLDYPGSTTDGLARARNQLRLAKPADEPVESGDDSQAFRRIPTVEAVAKALRTGKLDFLSLENDALTQNQREVRAELLDAWQGISSLPAGKSSPPPQATSSLQRFARLFSQTTGMYSQTQADAHTTWLSSPASFRTELINPKVSVLKRNITLIFTTGTAFTTGLETEFENMIAEEPWLKDEDILVFVAPLCPSPVADWISRRLPKIPSLVLDENKLLEIVRSVDNPTATGAFRKMLLQSIPSKQATVFTSENLVDSDKDIFVGRRDSKSLLVDGEKNYAIYGGRRIGKTSLLNAVNKDLKLRGFKTAYTSVEGETARVQGGLKICGELLQKLSLGLSCSSFTDFKSRILGYLDAEPDVRIVILLDELDRYIVARGEDRLPHDLIHTFRTIYQETNGRCRFILAGFIELWKEQAVRGQLSGADTPWFNFLVDSGPLVGLDDSDAQSIIRQGFQEILGIKLASASIPRLIIEKTTNHPAFVQKFCEQLHARLHRDKPDCLTEVDVDAVFRDRSDGNFVSFVNETLRQNLRPLPRLIVYLLAVEGTESFGLQDAKNVLRAYGATLGEVSDETIRDCLEELKITSVIRTHQGQNCYRFSVPSYPKILREFETGNRQAIPDLITKIKEPMQEAPL